MDPKKIDEALTAYIRPQSFPVGIALAESADQVPAQARHPQKDLGVELTICQAVSMARRYGWMLALKREDISCPLTYIPFGLAESVPFSVEGHACAGIYAETAAAGARTEQDTPRIGLNKARQILVAPLFRCAFEPQVIAIYGNSAQIMRLVQGALWKIGGSIVSSSTGRVDCAEIMLRPMNTGDAHYILPCSGDRIFGLTQDDEMAFSSPVGRWPDILEGLQGTHRGGIRYPIPVSLRNRAVFPDQYEALRREFEQGEK